MSNIAIAVLSVVDLMILLLMPLLDNTMYKDHPKIKGGRFFYNPSLETPIYRFLYSAAGVWILGIVLISALLIVKRYVYG